MNEEDVIKEMGESNHIIAVVGLSPKPHRASYDVGAYLQNAGYRIIPVNPSHAGKVILNETCYASLEDAAAMLAKEGQRIGIVDCFRKSEDIVPIAQSAIAVGAHCLWMQQGIENDEAAALASSAGLQVVMNKCLKTEHRKIRHTVR